MSLPEIENRTLELVERGADWAECKQIITKEAGRELTRPELELIWLWAGN